eukprot:5748192-Ditylum_brightwellii.AAC.1
MFSNIKTDSESKFQILSYHDNYITKLLQHSFVHDKDIQVLNDKVSNEFKDVFDKINQIKSTLSSKSKIPHQQILMKDKQ